MNIFELSLKTQFADFHLWRFFKTGNIIVLSGNSTSGKTTIAKALQNLEPGRIEYDIDFFRDPTQQHTNTKIEDHVIKGSISLALKGYNITLHLENCNRLIASMYKYNIDLHVIRALVFCPVKTLTKRLDNRNEEAQDFGLENEFRDYLTPLKQYSKLYASTENRTKSLEVLELSKVAELYKEQFDKMSNQMIKTLQVLLLPIPSEEQVSIDKQNSLLQFLVNLGFNHNKTTIYVAPKDEKDYDFIFNTEEYSALDIAGILREEGYT